MILQIEKLKKLTTTLYYHNSSDRSKIFHSAILDSCENFREKLKETIERQKQQESWVSSVFSKKSDSVVEAQDLAMRCMRFSQVLDEWKMSVGKFSIKKNKPIKRKSVRRVHVVSIEGNLQTVREVLGGVLAADGPLPLLLRCSVTYPAAQQRPEDSSAVPGGLVREATARGYEVRQDGDALLAVLTEPGSAESRDEKLKKKRKKKRLDPLQ